MAAAGGDGCGGALSAASSTLTRDMARRLELVDAQASAGMDRGGLLQEQAKTLVAKFSQARLQVEEATAVTQAVVGEVVEVAIRWRGRP